MTEQELIHFGIPGMRWGTRRGSSIKKSKKVKLTKAQKLSKKWGIEIGEGVSKRHAKGAVKEVSRQLTNAVRSGQNQLRSGQINNAQFQAILKEVSSMQVKSITKERTEEGKAYYNATLRKLKS